MKNLFYAAIVFISFCTISCSTDDSMNEISIEENEIILGTWKFSQYFQNDTELVETHLCLGNSTITFNLDESLLMEASVLTEDELDCEIEISTSVFSKLSKNKYLIKSSQDLDIDIELTLDTSTNTLSADFVDTTDNYNDTIRFTLEKQ